MIVGGLVTDLHYAITHQALFRGPSTRGYHDEQSRRGLIVFSHDTFKANGPLRLKDVSFPPLGNKRQGKKSSLKKVIDVRDIRIHIASEPF